jgi:hypothetical protein
MNSNFCGKCGASNAGQNRFCLQCGLNLEPVNQAVNPFGQPAQFQQNAPPTPNYAAQNAYQPQVNNSAPFQPNYSAPNNFTPPPNNNFQSPFVQAPPLSQTVESQKKGIGGKILSILGTLFVGFILLLKFGVIFLRLGRLGGIWIVIGGVLIVGVWLVASLIKRSAG